MGIAGEALALAPGAYALPSGLLWLERGRTLVAADVHFAYEDAIGGVLPLWSTAETLDLLHEAIGATGARELLFLGDVIHSSWLSDGAARTVTAALDALRRIVEVTVVAGNHEGRTRGENILGPTVESAHRDGWLLEHGDELSPGLARRIVGHLHPSLRLARGESVPVFLASESLIVLPAITPYSPGLNVTSADCVRALRALRVPAEDVDVVAASARRLYPFGRLCALRTVLDAAPPTTGGARRGRRIPKLVHGRRRSDRL